jgi:hypothetical protein
MPATFEEPPPEPPDGAAPDVVASAGLVTTTVLPGDVLVTTDVADVVVEDVLVGLDDGLSPSPNEGTLDSSPVSHTVK